MILHKAVALDPLSLGDHMDFKVGLTDELVAILVKEVLATLPEAGQRLYLDRQGKYRIESSLKSRLKAASNALVTEITHDYVRSRKSSGHISFLKNYFTSPSAGDIYYQDSGLMAPGVPEEREGISSSRAICMQAELKALATQALTELRSKVADDDLDRAIRLESRGTTFTYFGQRFLQEKIGLNLDSDDLQKLVTPRLVDALLARPHLLVPEDVVCRASAGVTVVPGIETKIGLATTIKMSAQYSSEHACHFFRAESDQLIVTQGLMRRLGVLEHLFGGISTEILGFATDMFTGATESINRLTVAQRNEDGSAKQQIYELLMAQAVRAKLTLASANAREVKKLATLVWYQRYFDSGLYLKDTLDEDQLGTELAEFFRIHGKLTVPEQLIMVATVDEIKRKVIELNAEFRRAWLRKIEQKRNELLPPTGR